MKKYIPLFKVAMSESSADAVQKVLYSGYIGQGEKVEEFENTLKNWFGNKLILTMNSGTSAEHLAIHLLKAPHGWMGEGIAQRKWPGIEEGDEALATPLTCTASNFPLLANGLRIKWVDINENDFNMDLEDLSRKISPKTKIIMGVHWGGYPMDLNQLHQIQFKAYNLFGFKPAIIEDCAHAMGSEYKDNKLGNYGNICTFSLQAIKHLTSVDGGLLVLPHGNLYNRAKLLRWYGINRDDPSRTDFRCESDIEEWGFKFHMNDINATIGIENFKKLESIIERHRANAEYYNQELAGISGITLPERKSDRKSSYWLYTIKVENRSLFMNAMKEKGIQVSRVHERNDIHSCVKEFRSVLPTMDKVWPLYCCIPVGWWVSDEDREFIVNSIKEGW